MLMVPCYVGLDYHDETIRVCAVAEDGKVIVNRNVPNDPAAVRLLIGCRGLSVQAVAIEACCGSADFATALEAQTGWPVKLAHPAAVRHLKKSREKTDHGDAWLLADLLRVNYLPEVWLADRVTRQLRRLVRYRQGLVAERKNVKLRIRALLREERLFVCRLRPWTKRWLAWIVTLPLESESRWVLQEELRRLQELDEAVKRCEQRFAEATRDDATVEKLLKQKDVGLVTAVVMRASVGRFDRFRGGKQLSRYHGVTPCNASSGKRQADAGLINDGNDLLRVIVIQLAQRLVRHDPYWKEFHARLRKTKPANVATAAVANRWLRRLYHEMVPARPANGIEKADLSSGSANGGSNQPTFLKEDRHASWKSTTKETTRTRDARVSSSATWDGRSPRPVDLVARWGSPRILEQPTWATPQGGCSDRRLGSPRSFQRRRLPDLTTNRLS